MRQVFENKGHRDFQPEKSERNQTPRCSNSVNQLTKMFYRKLFFPALVLVLIYACNPDRDIKNRPSPLMMDSTLINSANIKIIYSSPAVRERTIWGELVEYDKVWRTGANDATYLSASDDIFINGEFLKAGKYAIFTIPTKEEWTVIINSEWNQWGAYNYDKNKDVMRFTIKPKRSKAFSERMRFFFDNEQLVFHWENLTFKLDIE